MSRDLPSAPNLEHLKKQAKVLLRAAFEGDPATLDQFRAVGTFTDANPPKLADAQHLVAREYGFANWSSLKERVAVLVADSDPLAGLAAAVRSGEVAAAAAILHRHPSVKAKLNDAMPGYAFDGIAMNAAVEAKNTRMMDLLLDNGASIDAKTAWWAGGFASIDFADTAFVPELIARGATVNLYGAARHGMLDRVQALLRDDPQSVHMRGGDGQTPLHVAASIEIATLLLDHGADIDALDVDHESTPAMYLVRDHTDVTRYLMSRGCRTDILMASAVGDLALVRSMVDADPDVINTTVSPRWFPMRNHRAGGTIYIWTLGGFKSPHALAREFGHQEIYDFLMTRTPDSLKLALSAELGETQTFDSLLAQQPGLVAMLTDDEKVKVVSAAERNNVQGVKAMLDAGWPVDARQGRGATALHWAGFHGNADMIREILRHDPTIDIVESEFSATPLGWTLFGSENGWHRDTGDYPGAAAALVDAGAQLPDKLEAAPAVLAMLNARGLLKKR